MCCAYSLELKRIQKLVKLNDHCRKKGRERHSRSEIAHEKVSNLEACVFRMAMVEHVGSLNAFNI